MTSRSCVLGRMRSLTPRCVFALFCPETPPAPLERRSARRKAPGSTGWSSSRGSGQGIQNPVPPTTRPDCRALAYRVRPVRSAACQMWTPGVHLLPVLARFLPRREFEVFQEGSGVQVPSSHPTLGRRPCRQHGCTGTQKRPDVSDTVGRAATPFRLAGCSDRGGTRGTDSGSCDR
jgi:hypothetical protein